MPRHERRTPVSFLFSSCVAGFEAARLGIMIAKICVPMLRWHIKTIVDDARGAPPTKPEPPPRTRDF